MIGRCLVTVIFTCFNRKEFTVNCIKKLNESRAKTTFVIVDDKSEDNTVQKIKTLKDNGINIDLIEGTGNLYWAGGMRLGMQYALDKKPTDYYMLVNDDVCFSDRIIDKLIEYYEKITLEKGIDNNIPFVLVGPTKNIDGKLSYGGIKYKKHSIKYEIVGKDYSDKLDTFNMNCIFMSQQSFYATPVLDDKYIHSLADFDYGLQISKNDGIILMYNEYVGMCEDNDVTGGWQDINLTRIERMRKKESIKGAPFKPWFYFLKKNFGLGYALVYSVTPYLRILLKR